MREIPKKNYIILIITFVLSIMLSLYLASWYNMTNELKNEISIFTEHSLELKIEELDTYLVENPASIVLITNSNINNKLEDDIYAYLSQNALLDNFVYINISNYKDIEITNILNKISKIKISNNYPNIYLTENGKIVSSMLNKKEKINMKKIKNYIVKDLNND